MYKRQKYGGKEFAIQVKGLEMAGYDPRGAWGQGLSYSVANRGACHLASAIFVVENYFEFLDKYSTKGKAEFVWYFENLYNAINSLQLCIFEIYAFGMEQQIIRLTPKLLLRLVMKYFPKLAIKLIDMSIYSKFFEAVTGIKLNLKQFLKAGERTNVLERYLNTQLGVTSEDDTLPERFLKEGRETDPQKHVVPLKKMLIHYYKIRGYDQNGIPTNKLLKKLELEHLLTEKIFFSPSFPLVAPSNPKDSRFLWSPRPRIIPHAPVTDPLLVMLTPKLFSSFSKKGLLKTPYTRPSSRSNGV